MNDRKETTADKVLIIPCSGMGKTYGSVGREAAYVVVEDLRPNHADTLCLSLLTLQDKKAQQKVLEHATITIDGCPKACAKVNVEKSGSTPAAIFRVFDVFREHKDLRGGSVLDIGDNGRKLAKILAEKVATTVDDLCNGNRGG
ncbi:MAG: putative zinc-binding protein [Candidatus Hodarchaeota archaeon]